MGIESITSPGRYKREYSNMKRLKREKIKPTVRGARVIEANDSKEKKNVLASRLSRKPDF